MNKLSRDLINIINKYLDFSLKKLQNLLLLNTKCQIPSLYSSISLQDIILKCVNYGYAGFYFDPYDVDERFKQRILNELKLDCNKILYFEELSYNLYCVELHETSGNLVNILKLNL